MDLAADLVVGSLSRRPTVIAVDSMQVYKEIPIITNQGLGKRAELTSIVSVSEEWSMARHKYACERITENSKAPFVFDAGTGMYLNAILLDIPIAPMVDTETRQRAEVASARKPNPRRSSREMELEMAGYGKRGSIWEGDLRYDTTLVYLRPKRESLDVAIEKRSSKITHSGLKEAAALAEKFPEGIPNRSVRDSIGVKELVDYNRGKISLEEAESRISTRTRQLSRRQMKWFDKLSSVLQNRAQVYVAETPQAAEKAIQEFASQL